MGLTVEYRCECNSILVPDKDGANSSIYACPDCEKLYERRRSDRKWFMRPVEKKRSKGSGVKAPRPYFFGLLWE